MTMKILLPLDGSPHSLAAVRHAIDLVDGGLRARFVVVNVQPPARLFELYMADADTDMIARASAAAGRDALDVGRAILEQAEIDHEVEIVAGEPVPMLLDLIETMQCDAVIMGARGLGSVRAALLGSVSLELMRNARVPVTTVRAPDDVDDDAATAG